MVSINPAEHYRVHGGSLLRLLRARQEAISDRDLWRSRARTLNNRVEELQRQLDTRGEAIPRAIRLRPDEQGFEEA